MDSITLGDKFQTNLSEAEEFFLCSRNICISTSKLVLDYPSLRARAKIIDKACKVYLEVDDLETLVYINNVVTNKSLFKSVVDNTIFINSLGDAKLEKDHIKLYANFKYLPYNNHEYLDFEITQNLEEVPINILLCNRKTIVDALSSPSIYLANSSILSSALHQLCILEPTIWLTNQFDNLPIFSCPLNKITPYKVFLYTDDHLVYNKDRNTYRIPKYNQVVQELKKIVKNTHPLEYILREGYAVLGGRFIARTLFSGLQNDIHLYLTSPSHLDSVLSYFTNIEHRGNEIIARINNNTFIIHNTDDFKLSIESSPYSIYRSYFDGQQLYMTTHCMLSIVNGRIVYVEEDDIDNEEYIISLINLGFVFIDRQIPVSVSRNYSPKQIIADEYDFDEEIVDITTIINQ